MLPAVKSEITAVPCNTLRPHGQSSRVPRTIRVHVGFNYALCTSCTANDACVLYLSLVHLAVDVNLRISHSRPRATIWKRFVGDFNFRANSERPREKERERKVSRPLATLMGNLFFYSCYPR